MARPEGCMDKYSARVWIGLTTKQMRELFKKGLMEDKKYYPLEEVFEIRKRRMSNVEEFDILCRPDPS